MPPLRFLDLAPGDDAVISHRDGPDAQGIGWGEEHYERRHIRLVGRTADESGNIRDVYFDTRRYCIALWDPGISHEAPSLEQQGYARLAQGGVRTWVRNGAAWIESAAAARAGVVQLAALGAHQDKGAPLGTLLEGSRTNSLIQSAFKNGSFTGWTAAGTGSNGSALSVETSDLLWESSVVPQCLKIVAGSPIHAADLQETSTATATIAANSKVRVSIYRKDLVGGVGAYWALQRGVDSNWWRDSDQTWQASKTWNQWTYSSVWARHISKSIDVGTSGTTLTVLVGVPTTGTAGQQSLVGHVQIEVGEYATSPILTEAAAVTRAADGAYYNNDHGKRVWPAEGLTARIGFIPLWTFSELPTGASRVILESYYDADNYDRLFHDQASGLIFRRRRRAANTDATIAFTPTAGQLYRIAVRVCSSRGEWGLAAYTQSVFVDGVKGTDAVPAGVHTLPAEHFFRVGHRDNAGTPADVMDAHFQDLEVWNLVMQDGELLA